MGLGLQFNVIYSCWKCGNVKYEKFVFFKASLHARLTFSKHMLIEHERPEIRAKTDAKKKKMFMNNRPNDVVVAVGLGHGVGQRVRVS